MTCQLTVMNLATTGSCRSDVKGDVELSVFGVGAGEGLTAVRGHQSEGEGMRAVKTTFSRHRLRFPFGRSKLRPSRCGGRGATALPEDSSHRGRGTLPGLRNGSRGSGTG